MTYDFSVFSRGNYYKDSLYFKNTKGFRLYLLLIFRYIAKKRFHTATKASIRPAGSPGRSPGKFSRKAPSPKPAKLPRTPSANQKNPAPTSGTGEVLRKVNRLHRQRS